MRAKSQWTLGGVTLWLIAAILATLVVCSQTASDPRLPGESSEVELEVEGAD